MGLSIQVVCLVTEGTLAPRQIVPVYMAGVDFGRMGSREAREAHLHSLTPNKELQPLSSSRTTTQGTQRALHLSHGHFNICWLALGLGISSFVQQPGAKVQLHVL